MRKLIILMAAVAAAALAQSKPASKPENLVVNGGFEQGADPGAFKNYSPQTKDKLAGWTVTKGSIDVIGTYFKCAHGRCLDMNGSNNGTIRQTIATEAGKKYRLSFELSANSQCGDPKKVQRGVEKTSSKAS